MAGSKWYKTQIPRALALRVEKFIENNDDLGYLSVADFIKTATREKLESYKISVQPP